MRSTILKIKAIVIVSLLALLISNWKGESDLENQITITIHSIDKETKKPRVNLFDIVVVRKEGFGFPKAVYKKIGEYVTDSTGSVKVKIDSSKRCIISVKGLNVLGLEEFYPGHLKNGQEVNIEVFSTKNR